MAGLYPVLVQLPAHSRASATLTYQSELTLSPGTLVLVPLGARQTLGLVWDGLLAANSDGTSLPVAAPEKIKEISYAAQGLPALGLAWRRLLEFAASYYQRSTGEMVIGALPSALRQLTAAQLERATSLRFKRRSCCWPRCTWSRTTQRPRCRCCNRWWTILKANR